MHWGTVVLSLEPIMEPPVRFKNSAEKYGYQKKDAMIFQNRRSKEARRYY
jgi:hypothetical protein